jgi:hypothetical protein
VTPFDAKGRVDEDALQRHSVEVLASGAAGIVALATTGEATSLDEGERAAVLGVCAQVRAELGSVRLADQDRQTATPALLDTRIHLRSTQRGLPVAPTIVCLVADAAGH